MGKKQRILLVVANLGLGGQERVAINTIEILRRDYDVWMAVFDGNDAVYTPSCELINLNLPARDSFIGKVYNVLRRSARLYRLKKRLKIDTSYSFGTTANIVNAFSKSNDKVIVSLRGFRTVSNGVINRYIYLKSDAIIGVSQIICNKLKKLFPNFVNKIMCLYNPYDIGEILEKGKELCDDFDFTAPTIVTHGRLNEVKNYPRLIKAFSIVRNTICDAQLLIIGEGPERSRLEKIIQKYKLEGNVALIGFRKNPFSYISKSSLFVLSSFNEGFPNALIEGMAFLPAVSVDCNSGPREILCDSFSLEATREFEMADYGVLVRPASNTAFDEEITADDEILAKAILKIMQDKVLWFQMKELANKRVFDFSYDHYLQNLISILNSL